MQSTCTPFKARITEKLQTSLTPKELEVINKSDLHIGHKPEFDGSGETHIHIRIISTEFIGMKRISRHRKIYDILKSEMNDELHALSIEALAPGEKYTP
ncbi:BolA family transcriptional regulator [Candidatus Liberibacter sp.]|uniref:BolA family protein n=1 Tax=Candidatus Liberibacter sp. TaxID=34022 RepID=UPI0015F5B665|nr:BolA family protein [Candidatus Liberibacter sp.]MBA5724006.1 BolA family transcriptional regulator [Candidatus Liberibacter sp.]